MAVGCKTGDSWNQDLAKGWWNKHLPEFTAPLSLGDYGVSEAQDRVVVLQTVRRRRDGATPTRTLQDFRRGVFAVKRKTVRCRIQ